MNVILAIGAALVYFDFKPEQIFFSSGGISCLAFVYCFFSLEESLKHDIDETQNISSKSVVIRFSGALVALLLLSFSVSQVFEC